MNTDDWFIVAAGFTLLLLALVTGGGGYALYRIASHLIGG